mmetsp:Transcript_5428/g.19856  ORF Transcript_5428/g.19856 Transcript_5428/m.19856 type:complete len:113 (+) Transcript_5428:1366-1704(+)
MDVGGSSSPWSARKQTPVSEEKAQSDVATSASALLLARSALMDEKKDILDGLETLSPSALASLQVGSRLASTCAGSTRAFSGVESAWGFRGGALKLCLATFAQARANIAPMA